MIDHDKSGEPETIAQEQAESLQGAWSFEDIMEAWGRARDFWHDFHAETKALAKFASGDQWSTQANPGEVRVTMNMVPMFVRTVSNASRKNPPSINILPGDAAATEDQADIYDSFVDLIEQKSHAPRIYTDAIESATEQQIGGWRIVIEPNKDGNYEPRLKVLRDLTQFFPDPSGKEHGLADAQWFFLRDTMDKDNAKREWPNADLCDFGEDEAPGDPDTVTIAEFWYKDADRNGAWTQVFVSGGEILETNNAYPGTHFPIFLVHSRERMIDGKRQYECITRDIADQQRKLNYIETITAKAISNPVLAKILISDEQIGPYQSLYDNAHKDERFYLPYVKDSTGGGPIPLHQSPFPAELMALATSTTEAMRQVLGMRDPVKDLPVSQSGKALALQMSQTDVSTYGYHFALEMAQQQCGEALCELVKFYYNYPHVRNFVGAGGKVKTVKIMIPFVENGQLKKIDLSKGEFEVIVSSGPTWRDKSEQIAEKLGNLFQVAPQWLNVFGDIYVGSLDFEGAKEAAASVRATIDPKILAAREGGSPEDVAAIAQGKAAQLEQLVDQLTQSLQQVTQQRDQALDQNAQKAAMQKADHEHRERMASLQSADADRRAVAGDETKLTLEQMKQDGARVLLHDKSIDQMHGMAFEANIEAATGTNVNSHGY